MTDNPHTESQCIMYMNTDWGKEKYQNIKLNKNLSCFISRLVIAVGVSAV